MTATDPVSAVLGRAEDEPFASRHHDVVTVGWGDARKHRRVVRTEGGRELALQLPRGTFLADGAVLADDGNTAVVVRRPPEPALVLDLTRCSGRDDVRRALLLGYQLGNQHAPLEITDTEVRAPLMTGADTARRALADLGLVGRVVDVPLAAHGWSTTSSDHHEGHRHD
jgi:urease accessory protein